MSNFMTAILLGNLLIHIKISAFYTDILHVRKKQRLAQIIINDSYAGSAEKKTMKYFRLTKTANEVLLNLKFIINLLL